MNLGGSVVRAFVCVPKVEVAKRCGVVQRTVVARIHDGVLVDVGGPSGPCVLMKEILLRSCVVSNLFLVGVKVSRCGWCGEIRP